MRRSAADYGQLRDVRLQPPDEFLPLQPHLFRIFPEVRVSRIAGRGKGGNLRGGFGAGTPPFLLTAADNHRLQAQSLTYIQGSDAFRRMDLMPADADQVRTEGRRRKGDF